MRIKSQLTVALAVFMALTVAISAIPADDGVEGADGSNTIDLAEFIKEVVESGYEYDGHGVTVKWIPTSACTYSAHDTNTSDCLFANSVEDREGDGNNPGRVQNGNAQYSIFQGQADVSISNVNFVYSYAKNDPPFTLCQQDTGDQRTGTFGYEKARNAELQFLNSGDLTITGCNFDRVIVSPYGCYGETTIKVCEFSDVYNAYTIKDVYSETATIEGCYFTHCSGGIYFEGDKTKGSYTIKDNTFEDMDSYAADGKENTRGLIQFSAAGDYSGAQVAIKGNIYDGDTPIIRQLNETITPDVINTEKLEEDNPGLDMSNLFTSGTSEITYRVYLDVVNGNDSNKGTADNPVKTLAKALKLSEAGYTIMVTGDLGHSITGINKPITIMGDGNQPVAVSGGVTLPANVNGTVRFVNLSFNGSSTIGLYDDPKDPDDQDQYKNLDLVIDSCKFTNAGGNCVYIVPEINSLEVTGCTFTGSKDLKEGKQYLIWPYHAKTITITNNTFTGSSYVRSPIHLGEGHSEGTTAVVSGNTIDDFERGVQIAFTNGKTNWVTIEDNEFKDIGIKAWSACQPSEVATVFIHESLTDGTTVDFIGNSLTEGSDRMFYSEHKTLTAEDVVNAATFSGNTIDGEEVKTVSESSYSSFVAQVGNQKYNSLEAAIDAAMDGTDKTVLLISDITAGTWNQIWDIQGIIIDGQGHTISMTAIESLENHDAVLHSAGDNTFKNMTIDMSGITAASQAQGYKGITAVGGDTIENVKFIGSTNGDYGIHVGGTDATGESVTIRGCEFTGFDYAIGNQPEKDTNISQLDSLVIDGCTFENCDYASILYSPQTEFTNNSVDNGKVNIMHKIQTVTGNTFENKSRIKFYDTAAEFSKNSVSTDSYLAYGDDTTGQVDVSDNYWGGDEPSDAQLGGDSTKVSGNDEFYIDPDMSLKPDDAKETLVEGGTYIRNVDGESFAATADNGITVTLDLTFTGGATIEFTGITNAKYVVVTIKNVDPSHYGIEANILYEVTVQGIDSNEYTIGLPFTIPSGQDLNTLNVFYYEDGAEPADMGATMSGNIATFTTEHNSLYGIVMTMTPTPEPEPEPTPGGDDDPVSPPAGGDDDESLPPIIRPGGSGSSSSDDDTVTIVACAAAAAVAAILAVFLIYAYRKD